MGKNYIRCPECNEFGVTQEGTFEIVRDQIVRQRVTEAVSELTKLNAERR
jgi:hypothetical protein